MRLLHQHHAKLVVRMMDPNADPGRLAEDCADIANLSMMLGDLLLDELERRSRAFDSLHAGTGADRD